MLWLLWFTTQRNTVGMIDVSGDISDPILGLNKTRTILVLARAEDGIGNNITKRRIVPTLLFLVTTQKSHNFSSIVAQALIT